MQLRFHTPHAERKSKCHSVQIGPEVKIVEGSKCIAMEKVSSDTYPRDIVTACHHRLGILEADPQKRIRCVQEKGGT